MTFDVRSKRVYEPAERDDGYRVLVDHVWPRGVSRERALVSTPGRANWHRATSCGMWFDHDSARFAEFRARYRGELAEQTERMEELRRRAASGPVTIVYAARDREHNNAVVVCELLREG